jgi:hypothetical protein
VSDRCDEGPPSKSASDTSGAGAPRRAQSRRAGARRVVREGGVRRVRRKPLGGLAPLAQQLALGRHAARAPRPRPAAARGRARAERALDRLGSTSRRSSFEENASGARAVRGTVTWGGPTAPHNAAAPPPSAPSLGSEAPLAGSGLRGVERLAHPALAHQRVRRTEGARALGVGVPSQVHAGRERRAGRVLRARERLAARARGAARVPEPEHGERERGGEALLLVRARLDGIGGGDVCTRGCVGLGGGTEGGGCESDGRWRERR